jgi:hypothetical protein
MQLQTAAASTGSVINTTKTKYMRSKEIIGAANVDIKLNGQIYERVDNFKYVGALVTSHNETDLDNHWKTGIHSDDLGKKDFKENLWTKK